MLFKGATRQTTWSQIGGQNAGDPGFDAAQFTAAQIQFPAARLGSPRAVDECGDWLVWRVHCDDMPPRSARRRGEIARHWHRADEHRSQGPRVHGGGVKGLGETRPRRPMDRQGVAQLHEVDETPTVSARRNMVLPPGSEHEDLGRVGREALCQLHKDPAQRTEFLVVSAPHCGQFSGGKRDRGRRANRTVTEGL
ncbi:hypothetical protein GCM10009672_23140 [Nesterenkonia lutea]